MTQNSSITDATAAPSRGRTLAVLTATIVGAGTLATVLAAPASAGTSSSCDRTAWEAKVQGAPATGACTPA